MTVTASGAEGAWFFTTTAALRGADFGPAFLRVGPAFLAAAFFTATAGFDPFTGVLGPADFFTAFEARTVLAAPAFLACDFFTGDLTACGDRVPAADAPRAFNATFFSEAVTGIVATTAGAAIAALGDDFAAADVFLDLAFADPAPDLIRLDATDFASTCFAGAAATGATEAAGATAAPPAKLSSVRPAAMALRSHAGLGPRPPHWLPWPSPNVAPLAAPRFPFIAFEAEGGTGAEAEANFRSPAVRPYFAIVSLIFAMAPLASTASCFWAEAWRTAISRANWA